MRRVGCVGCHERRGCARRMGDVCGDDGSPSALNVGYAAYPRRCSRPRGIMRYPRTVDRFRGVPVFIEEYLQELRQRGFTPRAFVGYGRSVARRIRENLEANPGAVRATWNMAL